MWLVAGLGNPGAQYCFQRHNIGFMAIDTVLAEHGLSLRGKSEFQAETFRLSIHQTSLLLAKPMAYMNRSGESIRGLMDFYKITTDRLVVFHDDLDLPLGEMRIQKNRGHGGHNGVRSIHEILGSSDYIRIKLGIGRPAEALSVTQFVLSNFLDLESQMVSDLLVNAADSLTILLTEGYHRAASGFNRSYDTSGSNKGNIK